MRKRIQALLSVYDRLNESNRFAVLVHARMLVLRECVAAQYRIHQERRVWYRVKYPSAHWVR